MLRCALNGFQHRINITMTNEKELALLRRNIGDVTRLWSDVKNGRTNRENVVDLARVNNTDELFTHHYNMKICRGERI